MLRLFVTVRNIIVEYQLIKWMPRVKCVKWMPRVKCMRHLRMMNDGTLL